MSKSLTWKQIFDVDHTSLVFRKRNFQIKVLVVQLLLYNLGYGGRICTASNFDVKQLLVVLTVAQSFAHHNSRSIALYTRT